MSERMTVGDDASASDARAPSGGPDIARRAAGSEGFLAPSDCDRVPLVEQAATLIQLLARELKRDQEARFRAAPMTAAQLAVAEALAAHGSLRAGELAGAVCCVPANITALVDRLERKGYARRAAAADRRGTTVSLTDAGEEALEETRCRGRNVRLAAAIDEPRLAALVELLGPLYLKLSARGIEQ